MNTVKNIIDGSKKFTMRHINRLDKLYNEQRIYFTFWNSGTVSQPTNHLVVKWGLYSSSESLLHLTFANVINFVEYLQNQIAKLSHEIVIMEKQSGKYLTEIDKAAATAIEQLQNVLAAFEQNYSEGVLIQFINQTPNYAKLQQIRFYINQRKV